MPTARRDVTPRLLSAASGLAAAVWLATGGCSTPMTYSPDDDLRRSVLESARRELAESRRENPAVTTLDRTPRVQTLGLKPEIYEQLEQTSGRAAYGVQPTAVAPDLMGRPQQAVQVSLERVVLTSVRNNMAVQFAQLQPAIDEQRLVAAQSAFDWTLFSNVQWTRTDEPTVGSFVGPGQNREQEVLASVGVRRRMTSGGQIQLQQGANFTDNQTGSFPVPNPANQARLTLQVDQPLLRNFGSDVALADVRIQTNTQRDSIQELKAALLQTVRDAEEGYWQLVRATGELQIAQRLLNLGVEVRDVLKTRREANVDVKPSQFSDAVATVENRRAQVIRAENALRQLSDRLKQLMNDPDLTVGSEVMLLPVDNPLDAPMSFSLLEIMSTAIANRPEVQRALLAIDNTSIRQTLADNARLPTLDLRAQANFTGLDNNMDEAFNRMTDTNFVTFVVGLAFEMPVGNRGPEAVFRRTRLERMQSVIAYRDVVTRVLLEVKAALRNVVSAYTLIEQTRAARIAAAENLRTLLVEEKTTGGLTPEFLDLKLRRQDALAAAEQQELASITDYNIAVARLYATMGMGLERNRIRFEVPDVRSAGPLDAPPPAPTPEPADPPAGNAPPDGGSMKPVR